MGISNQSQQSGKRSPSSSLLPSLDSSAKHSWNHYQLIRVGPGDDTFPNPWTRSLLILEHQSRRTLRVAWILITNPFNEVLTLSLSMAFSQVLAAQTMKQMPTLRPSLHVWSSESDLEHFPWASLPWVPPILLESTSWGQCPLHPLKEFIWVKNSTSFPVLCNHGIEDSLEKFKDI